MWVIFPILGYVPIFHGLWVIRTVGCFPCGLYPYPSKLCRQYSKYYRFSSKIRIIFEKFFRSKSYLELFIFSFLDFEIFNRCYISNFRIWILKVLYGRLIFLFIKFKIAKKNAIPYLLKNYKPWLIKVRIFNCLKKDWL